MSIFRSNCALNIVCNVTLRAIYSWFIFPITVFAGNAVDECAHLSEKNTVLLQRQISQIIIVKPSHGIHATVIACQKAKGQWQKVFNSSATAVIGRNGLVTSRKKHEGDLKTPAGIFAIGETFGTAPLALKMDYRYITNDDKYIDDSSSKDYNSWVYGETDAKHYEIMLIKAYRLGAVINYNKHPTKPDAGSAIFMHIWKNELTPTSGCIAMSEKNLLKILLWLDKRQHPHIWIKLQ